MFTSAILGVGVSLTVPLVTRAIIDGPVTRREIDLLLPLALLALGLSISEVILVWVRRWAQSRAVSDLEATLRHDLYVRLQSLPMEFHTRWQSGQLLSRVTVDLSTIRRFMGFGLLFLVINILQLVVVTILLLRLYWPLGVVVLVAAVPIILLSLRFEKKYLAISRRVQDQQGDLATAIEESALGFRVIKAFGRREHVKAQFDDSAVKLYGTSIEKVRLASRFWTFLGVIPNLTLVIVLLLGALAVGRNTITLGTLVAFITLMLSLIWPVAALGTILAMAQEAMTSADRISEILDTQSSLKDGTDELTKPRGHLRLENVSFRFTPDSPDVLHDINLDLPPGTTLALVGPTGSGKTTLTALLPRLYDVTGGRITIDGHDVRDLTMKSLRNAVASAFDDPTLFSMSVRENITLGRPDATEADIQQALQIAQATFANELPWGLDTRVGEQGMSLSGGQRQRLALARAVLARPAVLVLDDTLSALDVHTEALVEEALRNVLAETTGIVVAHRASTVMLADQVALLQNGTITHVGTHAELLATVPAYRLLLAAEEEEVHA
ncbi:ATP-binding cassette subfamily B protein [Kribbella sp. VKM Ac-2527]|uniref:ATP-binding cassette subfamily B protein n=1 Tax=Kribbella caucasensis TaxID=2512215 RepID=A0A4R6KCI2_9ACTN|nr:ABC transporter ATP-binding protein [Kribbella sp. VKM Ac-2527]TDO47309.1 ATP-binding cassette subfamily B protein [Kribbella sp. VKM Ac-2527]